MRHAENRDVRAVAALFCLLLVTACGEAPTAPTSPLDAEFTLAPGQARRIGRTGLSVRFDGVSGDSRCPADALCILGGSAAVHITVTSAGTARDYQLHTGDLRPVMHEGVTIALVRLEPYPFSARRIAPDEYRATLKATR
jgi:hypothetical protein